MLRRLIDSLIHYLLIHRVSVQSRSRLTYNRDLTPTRSSHGQLIPLAITLSDTQEDERACSKLGDNRSQPPRYPTSEPSGSAPASPPPAFSSLYTSPAEVVEAYKTAVTEVGASISVPAYDSCQSSASSQDVVAETKAALPQDTKGESSKKEEDSEPPPAYSEGFSPLESFTYLMAAAGGAASIITQVQQGGAPPINTLGGWWNNCDPVRVEY